MKLYKTYAYPGQDIKRYLSGVRLGNRKVFCTQGTRTKHFEHTFFVIYFIS